MGMVMSVWVWQDVQPVLVGCSGGWGWTEVGDEPGELNQTVSNRWGVTKL